MLSGYSVVEARSESSCPPYPLILLPSYTLAPSHPRTLAPSHPRTLAPSHPRTFHPASGCQPTPPMAAPGGPTPSRLCAAHSGAICISAVGSPATATHTAATPSTSPASTSGPVSCSVRELHALACREAAAAEGHLGDVRCFDWSSDRLLTGGEDGRICAWRERAGEPSGGAVAAPERKLKKSKQAGGSRHAPY